jgi:hypothetical protein
MGGRAGGWAWAALALVVGSAAAEERESPDVRPALVVMWSDPQLCLPRAVRGALLVETAALFARWGVRLVSSEGFLSEGAHDVRVVLLDRVRHDGQGRPVLGETHAEPRELPAVWILVPNVRGLLERAERGRSPGALARALARVVAHEILHVLAPGLDHSSHGLMRAGLDAADLTRPWIPLNDAYQRALVDALRPPPTRLAAQRAP